MPDEYYGPEFPEGCETVWAVFQELNSGRQYQSMISFDSIKSYCSLTGIKLFAWQLNAIKRLDSLFVASAHKEK